MLRHLQLTALATAIAIAVAPTPAQAPVLAPARIEAFLLRAKVVDSRRASAEAPRIPGVSPSPMARHARRILPVHRTAMARRDKIVEFFRKLIAEKGEAAACTDCTYFVLVSSPRANATLRPERRHHG